MALELVHGDTDNPDTYDVYLVEMVWVAGDWKIKADTTAITAEVGVTSLGRFTRWWVSTESAIPTRLRPGCTTVE